MIAGGLGVPRGRKVTPMTMNRHEAGVTRQTLVGFGVGGGIRTLDSRSHSPEFYH